MEIDAFIKALCNHRGNAFPLAAAVILCLMMLFSGITEYFRLMIVAQGVREALQDAVLSTVSDNYDEVYHGVREGYSGGYRPGDSGFEEALDEGDIYARLDRILGLEEQEGAYIKRTEAGQMEFKIWDLEVNLHNAPLAAADRADRRFEIDTAIMLEVPVSFGGRLLPAMKIKVKNSAGYTPKF